MRNAVAASATTGVELKGVRLYAGDLRELSHTARQLLVDERPERSALLHPCHARRNANTRRSPKGDEPHRYATALKAARRELGLGRDAPPDEVRDALAGAGLARGTLTGCFGR